jgi:hypothetical protein
MEPRLVHLRVARWAALSAVWSGHVREKTMAAGTAGYWAARWAVSTAAATDIWRAASSVR